MATQIEHLYKLVKLAFSGKAAFEYEQSFRDTPGVSTRALLHCKRDKNGCTKIVSLSTAFIQGAPYKRLYVLDEYCSNNDY